MESAAILLMIEGEGCHMIQYHSTIIMPPYIVIKALFKPVIVQALRRITLGCEFSLPTDLQPLTHAVVW